MFYHIETHRVNDLIVHSINNLIEFDSLVTDKPL